jgi:hypothetical protein
MKAARFAESHATTVEFDEDWRYDASCRGRPDDFDLDVIRDNKALIRDALATCHHCPVRRQCGELTQGLVERKKPPKDMVQAGVLWNVHGKPYSRMPGAGGPRKEAAT